MTTLKRILSILAIVLAVVGLVACAVGIYYSWALNTPLTDSLTRALTAADTVLTQADTAVTRVNSGITTARSATSTIQGAVQAAGDTIVNTDLAFTVLERTVGDTLFPVVVEISETAHAVAGTLIGINDTLEAANRLPFVEVPTLTAQLDVATAELAEARARVDEVRTEVQTLKAETVARPVTAITSRTEPLLERLDAAQATLSDTQASLNATLSGVRDLNARLPGLLDSLSVVLTLVLLWLLIAQVIVIDWAWHKFRALA